jgi:hypothetical protein
MLRQDGGLIVTNADVTIWLQRACIIRRYVPWDEVQLIADALCYLGRYAESDSLRGEPRYVTVVPAHPGPWVIQQVRTAVNGFPGRHDDVRFESEQYNGVIGDREMVIDDSVIDEWMHRLFPQ